MVCDGSVAALHSEIDSLKQQLLHLSMQSKAPSLAENLIAAELTACKVALEQLEHAMRQEVETRDLEIARLKGLEQAREAAVYESNVIIADKASDLPLYTAEV